MSFQELPTKEGQENDNYIHYGSKYQHKDMIFIMVMRNLGIQQKYHQAVEKERKDDHWHQFHPHTVFCCCIVYIIGTPCMKIKICPKILSQLLDNFILVSPDFPFIFIRFMANFTF